MVRCLGAMLSMCGWLTLASTCLVAQSPGETRAKQVAVLIERLDDDRYLIREAASRELQDLGDEAAEALAAAKSHPSEEVRWRVAAILERMKISPLMKLREDVIGFASQPDERLDIEEGMWILSRILAPEPHKNPPARRAELSRQLDEMAAKVRERLGKDVPPEKTDPQKAVEALRKVLAEDYGLKGNEEDYYNPSNSTLEGVLTTRKGLPIALSHVMVAVARRAEIPIVGLPVTGRYIVKYDGSRAPEGFPRDDIFIHPYEGFKILSREDRIQQYSSHDPDRMVPAGKPRETLQRLLSNLHSAMASRTQPGDDVRRKLLADFEAALAGEEQVEEAGAVILPLEGRRRIRMILPAVR